MDEDALKSDRPDSGEDEPNPLLPKEKDPPTVSSPKQVSGGLPSVATAIKRAIAEMGPFRALRTLRKVNQFDGFDCPGCAWPDPEDRRGVIEFCENGAKAVAEEATQRCAGPDFFSEHALSQLAGESDYWLGQQGRLTEPLWRAPSADHYAPISWDDAFDLVADSLVELNNPDEAVFYTSGRTSNEAAFLYQLFVRLFGTNNLPDCSNMCHESSGVALTEVIGIGKGTVKLKDFEHADAIFVIGQNPGSNHPRMLTALQQAARRGCRIVSINPLPEAGTNRFIHPQNPLHWAGGGTKLASLFLPVKINGDVALLKGVMKAMLAVEDSRGGVFDHDFIAKHTVGYDDFVEDLRKTSWDLILAESGLSRIQIDEAAQIALDSQRMIWCWAMGLTQHKNAVDNIQEIVNLLLLGGHLGRRGAGVCPVRGHSNVQGDRTMGIWERPSADFLDRLGRTIGFDPPKEAGFNTVEAIHAMLDGRAKVFFAMGGNFLSATPDTIRTAQALRNCRLTVQVSTKLNRAHLITGRQALILPCLGRTERDRQKGGEQFVSVENSMGIVHLTRGNLAPRSQALLSEARIVARLAMAVAAKRPGLLDRVDWDSLTADYDQIRDLIARTIPGFSDYNQRVRQRGGFYLPNPVRDDLEFKTASGKAMFTVHKIKSSELQPDQFLMMTIRSHDQYNTTIYGMDDRYRGISAGRQVVMMNKDDMASRGFKPGDRVDISNHFGGTTRVVKDFEVVPYPIPRRCLASYFPEANALVPLESTADKSHTPTSKSIVVTLAAAS